MEKIRKQYTFTGHVQGVGFRYSAQYLAQAIGVTGWVKNEWDDTVVMEVQGREQLIYKLMEGLNRNMFITIEWIDTEEKPLENESCFCVR